LTSPERLQDATIHHHIGVDVTLCYFIISFVVPVCVLMCVFAVIFRFYVRKLRLQRLTNALV
jgi:hypothetical protein